MKREVIEDDLGQTPEEGSSTDGDESYDGDGDQYRNRKEERFIDYYRYIRRLTIKSQDNQLRDMYRVVVVVMG